MPQLLKGPESRIAVELIRTEDRVVIATREEDSPAIKLVDQKLKWQEPSKTREGVIIDCVFDRLYTPLTTSSGEPYPFAEGVRKIIRGTLAQPPTFIGGVLLALADVLPAGNHHLFTAEDGFIGRFESYDDAVMIAKALNASQHVIFDSPETLKLTPLASQQLLCRSLDIKPPAKPMTLKQCKETHEMAAAATKKATPKKVAKAKSANKRADGPVAKARAIFEKMKDKPTPDILKATEEAGINRGTATTQLGRWRKENGIKVNRGGDRKPKTDKKDEAAASAPKKTATPKTSKKPKTDKKDDAAKAKLVTNKELADVKAKNAAAAKAKKTPSIPSTPAALAQQAETAQAGAETATPGDKPPVDETTTNGAAPQQ